MEKLKNMDIQVEKQHYSFLKYQRITRFASYFLSN